MHKEPDGNIADAKKALDIVKVVYNECNYRVNV